jgi:hypothetical protein
MDAQIGLLVSVQIEAAQLNDVIDWLFEDGRSDAVPSPRYAARASDIHRNQFHRGAAFI